MRIVVLCSILTVLILPGSIASAQHDAAQPQFKAVASVMQIMEAITIPASEILWAVADEEPQTDAEWTNVQNQAIALAESGNLLMISGRARDSGAWMKASRDLVDAAEGALKAAQAKDVEAILDAGDTIYRSCQGCHDEFLK